MYAPGTTLQSVLASATATTHDPIRVTPHHPITCKDDLALKRDGSLECSHALVPPDEPRLLHCINMSVACLIIELGSQL